MEKVKFYHPVMDLDAVGQFDTVEESFKELLPHLMSKVLEWTVGGSKKTKCVVLTHLNLSVKLATSERPVALALIGYGQRVMGKLFPTIRAFPCTTGIPLLFSIRNQLL